MYTAMVNVYSAGSGWVGDTHADEKAWKTLHLMMCPGNAGDESHTSEGDRGWQSRFILIDYARVNEPDYSGVYKLSDDQVCDIVITIKKADSGYTYSISGKGVESSGKLNILKEGDETYVVFSKTLRNGDNTAIEGLYSEGKITVQNYGNSLNQYVCFKKCDVKFLEFLKEE